MKKYLRKEEMLEYIRSNRTCSAEEISKQLNISISTVHRDLDILQREGEIVKAYGAISVIQEKDMFRTRIIKNENLKKRVAKKAIEFIKNGECIFIDNSTTSYHLAEQICLTNFKRLLIVSDSGSISNFFFK